MCVVVLCRWQKPALFHCAAGILGALLFSTDRIHGYGTPLQQFLTHVSGTLFADINVASRSMVQGFAIEIASIDQVSRGLLVA